jgi:predicted PurR-regulated permease PerM
MPQSFNNKIKQIIFLVLLVFMIVIGFNEVSSYVAGILGAITLYILSREKYFQFIYKKKWSKSFVAFLFILFYFLLLGIPVYLAITLISPKINDLINDPAAIITNIKGTLLVIEQKMGFKLTSENTINTAVEKITGMLPSFFNSTANLISNLVIMLFLLYYMLYSGSEMERTLFKIIPLKDRNTKLLAAETKGTIKSNAIGIPLISLIQGITAGIGYYLFSVNDAFLWGFLTGVFSFLPVLGTMIIWVPLCIYMYATGSTGAAIGLAAYSAVITANIDYFARIGIMKKLGDVHPLITLFGIIIGLNLFGFIGLIFGPLLLNYIIVLFKIYMNEFVENEVNGKPVSAIQSVEADMQQ